MKPKFIGIGLTLIFLGTGLSVVGHYDGILGADDPESFLSQESSQGVTVRLTVLGTPAQATERFETFDEQMLVKPVATTAVATGSWVPVRLDSTQAEAYLRFVGTPPIAGTLLVFRGDVQSHWPIYDAETDVVGHSPILFLEPTAYHAPLLFKE